MNNHRYCVIMAGGNGNKFWPISREDSPKQFIKAADGGDSFLNVTYNRCAEMFPKENIIVITLARFAPLVHSLLPDLPENNLLLEPYGRKTGPCVVYSTYSILKRDPAAVVMFTPSDLIIANGDLYREAIEDVFSYAEAHKVLMTIGIVPKRPDTNYGYIQARGGAQKNDRTPMKVKTFTEKPSADLAKIFCKSGEFYWNSGIFVWRADTIREELEKYMPQTTCLFAGWEKELGTDSERRFVERAYAGCENISIDYGVMENTDRAMLYPAKFSWSDLDSWDTFYNIAKEKDGDGNMLLAGNATTQDSKGNIVICQDKEKLVAVKGLNDFIVIDTGDVLIVCPKDDPSYRDLLTSISDTKDFERYK